MSIPRLAIERPVTMFMLSGVIILIGAVSLARLPVDLMPDVSYPSITAQNSARARGSVQANVIRLRRSTVRS